MVRIAMHCNTSGAVQETFERNVLSTTPLFHIPDLALLALHARPADRTHGPERRPPQTCPGRKPPF